MNCGGEVRAWREGGGAPYARGRGSTLTGAGGFKVRRSRCEETPPPPRAPDSLEATGGSPSLPSENAVLLVSEAGAPSRGHAGHCAARAFSVLEGLSVPGDSCPLQHI